MQHNKTSNKIKEKEREKRKGVDRERERQQLINNAGQNANWVTKGKLDEHEIIL